VKRWAFNLLASASLALGVLTVVLWVRSYWRRDYLDSAGRWSFVGVTNPKGYVLLMWGEAYPPGQPARLNYLQFTPYDLQQHPSQAVRNVGPIKVWAKPTYREVAIRCWALVLLFSLARAAWLMRGPLVRRRRVRLGLCRHCGYDLRATPGCCPECGREAIAAAKKIEPRIEH
jgi:hypothetical protein